MINNMEQTGCWHTCVHTSSLLWLQSSWTKLLHHGFIVHGWAEHNWFNQENKNSKDCLGWLNPTTHQYGKRGMSHTRHIIVALERWNTLFDCDVIVFVHDLSCTHSTIKHPKLGEVPYSWRGAMCLPIGYHQTWQQQSMIGQEVLNQCQNVITKELPPLYHHKAEPFLSRAILILLKIPMQLCAMHRITFLQCWGFLRHWNRVDLQGQLSTQGWCKVRNFDARSTQARKSMQGQHKQGSWCKVNARSVRQVDVRQMQGRCRSVQGWRKVDAKSVRQVDARLIQASMSI